MGYIITYFFNDGNYNYYYLIIRPQIIVDQKFKLPSNQILGQHNSSRPIFSLC